MLRLQPPISTLTHANPAGQGQICLKIHFSLLSGGPLPAEALGEEEPVAAQCCGGALAWKTLAVLGGVTSGGNLGVSSASCRLGMAGKQPTAASGAEAEGKYTSWDCVPIWAWRARQRLPQKLGL